MSIFKISQTHVVKFVQLISCKVKCSNVMQQKYHNSFLMFFFILTCIKAWTSLDSVSVSPAIHTLFEPSSLAYNLIIYLSKFYLILLRTFYSIQFLFSIKRQRFFCGWSFKKLKVCTILYYSSDYKKKSLIIEGFVK